MKAPKPPKPPAPPKHLDKEGRAHWYETLEFCEELQASQLSLLQSLCELWQRKEGLRRDIDVKGHYIEDRWGQMKPNPLLKDEAATYRNYIAYRNQLGLDVEN